MEGYSLTALVVALAVTLAVIVAQVIANAADWVDLTYVQ